MKVEALVHCATLSCSKFVVVFCGLRCFQKVFVVKTCLWFFVSVAETDHTNRVSGCLSTTCVNGILSPLSCFFCENVSFLAPAATPSSQAFCLQVIGSSMRIFTSLVMLVFRSHAFTLAF